jgi:RecB family endonuclease NucS
MELKAIPARYEVATQLAKYKDELISREKKHILMWLVAPQISNSVREFLDRIGIEYSEIHEAEFRHVAERHPCPPTLRVSALAELPSNIPRMATKEQGGSKM